MIASFVAATDKALRILLNPNDWFAQHQGLCLVGIVGLIVFTEVLTHA